jgi:hypothetical protein
MKKTYWSLLPLLLLSISIFSQKQIPLELEGNVKAPVIFELPEEHRALLFFFTTKSGSAQVRAIEVDDSMAVTRSAPVKVFTAPKQQDKIAVTGSFHPAGSNQFFVYFKVGKKQIWGAAVDRSTLAITWTPKIDLSSKQYVLGGKAYNGRFYLVSRKRNRRKGGKLIIYETADGRTFKENTIEINKSLRMFDKRYGPLFVPENTELNAAVASNPDKVYCSNNKMYFVTDTVVALYGNVISRTLYTAVDLQTYLPEHGLFSSFKVEQPEDNKTSSAVYDGNLFQISYSKDYFSFNIFRIADKKVLFTQELHRNDSIGTLFNTPMIMPKENFLGFERSFSSVHKLTKKMLDLEPFVQVRKSGNDYVVVMGGYLTILVPVATGGVVPSTIPSPMATSGGYKYNRSAYFYSVIGADNFDHQTQRLEHTFQEQMITIEDRETGVFSSPRSTGIFPVLGRYWFGYFIDKNNTYYFVPLK